MILGNFVQQPDGYTAFIPSDFPPEEAIVISPEVQLADSAATLALGKLDGIAQLIPDIDFFTLMYVRKEAALSSNIEGTKATMHDSLKADIKITEGVPRDVENILHYISAMKLGLDKLPKMPLSLRVVRELHGQLLDDTAEGKGKTPGEFRKSQNWIGGTRPDNADFVPPPPHELNRVLGDFEKFLNNSQPYSPLVKVALMHAQFETIHPFLDGNGRTGRLLITLKLCYDRVLEYPVLYLSEYFKRNRDVYFERLSDYHDKSDINRWLLFFLEGVKEVALEATEVSKAIVKLRESHMAKAHSLGGRQAPSAIKLLMGLYRQPIVDIATVQQITELSRPAANGLVQKFVEIGILAQTDESKTYGRQFSYDEYLNLFTNSSIKAT
jgi:Fic family protein